ncbi:serine-threonine/tyrosine-protein kinase catalytic domain-containing protein [Tanacetum coccineum]
MQHEGLISLLDDDDDDDDDNDDDIDEYWEKKLPQNYQRYIEMSDKPLDYATKKELYLIFCHGFLADKGQLWFSVSKPMRGICSVQPAHLFPNYRFYVETSQTLSLSESRFSLVKKLGNYEYFVFGTTLLSVMFSPQYNYACYLLFKLRDNHSVPDNTLLFSTECELDGISMGGMISYWSMYPMNIPTIKPNNDYGLHDSSNIPKAEGLAMKKDRTEHLGYARIKERKDGWMEAMLFKPKNKLQDQKNGCRLRIDLVPAEARKLNGMIIEGIEFRPYI